MIVLREAGTADLDSFYRLDQVCFSANIAYTLGEFRSLLRSSRTISAVAEEGGTLAGFVIAQNVRVRGTRGGQVVTIDVAPEFRRRGIGRLLMERLCSQLKDAEAEWIRLEVAIDDSGAQRFYLSLGYEPVGRIADYYPGGLDALVMEKDLSLLPPQ